MYDEYTVLEFIEMWAQIIKSASTPTFPDIGSTFNIEGSDHTYVVTEFSFDEK